MATFPCAAQYLCSPRLEASCTNSGPFRQGTKTQKTSSRALKPHLPHYIACKRSLRVRSQQIEPNQRPDVKQDLNLERCGVAAVARSAISGLLAAVTIASGVLAPSSAIAVTFPCERLEEYYASTKGLTGTALKAKLHEIIAGHKVYSYAQVWEALKVLDAADEKDPLASPDVVEIYSQRAAPKEQAGKPEGWNREHLWPRSFGLPNGTSQFSDLHNLRPADTNVNSSRGNKFYDDCQDTSTCLVPANQEAAPDTASGRDTWTPPAKVRGDIARALFYMAVRYEGEEKGAPDLELSDTPSISAARMGRLSTLLRWHLLDPPSPSEALRNGRVCAAFQHNRNPFTDHPEFVAQIWGTSLSQPTPQGGQSQSKPLVNPPSAWINELHYENAGQDQMEFVEVAAGPGTDMESLEVLLYNGADGKVYQRVQGREFRKGEVFSGGVTLFWAPVVGVQNGPADGLALVQKGRVLQLLSYEGTFTAVDGPAAGKTSVDVGVRESESTKIGTSIGVVNNKGLPSEAKWVKLCKATPGLANGAC